MKRVICIALLVVLSFSLFSCGNKDTADLWETALYTEDTELGNGEKTIFVDVITEEKNITFKEKMIMLLL